MATKVAVVTGANKGIGFSIVKELCKRFDGIVYLTSRDEERGKKAVENLKSQGLHPHYFKLDVANKESIMKFKEHIEKTRKGIDILVNNAAVNVTEDLKGYGYETAKEIVDINFKSMLDIEELLFPLLRENARVVNISSDCGHLSNLRNKYWIKRLSDPNLKKSDVVEFVDWYLQSMLDGTFKEEDFADEATVVAYRVSKIGVSALTILQQKALEDRGIKVNSMHPGLVQTDMTRKSGFFTTDEAAKTPVWLALDAPDSLKGQYVWYDRKILDWYDANADYYFKHKTMTG